jgi:hypothetical protein
MQHFGNNEHGPLCGGPLPVYALFTLDRSKVSCPACLDELERGRPEPSEPIWAAEQQFIALHDEAHCLRLRALL